MKHIFETAIDSVNTAYPSIYTKQDVVKLIQDIQAGVETFSAEKPTTQFATDFEALEKIKQSSPIIMRRMSLLIEILIPG